MLQLNTLDCHGVFECFKFLPPFSMKYKESCIDNDKVKKMSQMSMENLT